MDVCYLGLHTADVNSITSVGKEYFVRLYRCAELEKVVVI